MEHRSRQPVRLRPSSIEKRARNPDAIAPRELTELCGASLLAAAVAFAFIIIPGAHPSVVVVMPPWFAVGAYLIRLGHVRRSRIG